jgi:hypothetical protein
MQAQADYVFKMPAVEMVRPDPLAQPAQQVLLPVAEPDHKVPKVQRVKRVQLVHSAD